MKYFPSYILVFVIIAFAYSIWQDIGSTQSAYVLTNMFAIKFIATMVTLVGGSWLIGYFAGKK